MIEKKCLNCGKVFYVKPYREKNALYCSRSCSSKANYDLTLGHCDKTYLIGNQFRKGKKPTNSFKNGHIPWNKGIKGIHLSEDTEFKKGRKPNFCFPVGTIRIRKEKGKPRNFIKIAEPNKWKYYAVFLWEQANGKIPKGYVIHHINKNRLDDRLDNLVCLTRSEHINLHRKDLSTKKDK